MTILYKLFQSLRIACFCAVILITTLPHAIAAGSLFTVDEIAIDTTAENAIAAREKAFEEAQIKAFGILAERMLSESELQNFTTPKTMQISTLIQDFEVRNEKLSSTRYSAIYKFRFKDSAVRAHFSRRGASYTDIVSKPLLILPFMETQDGVVLWSPVNRWMSAWNQTSNTNGITPTIVPLGDLMDIRDIGDEEALTYNPRRLASMLRRYNASESVIALARMNTSGHLEIEIYRTDRQNPEYVHQITQSAIAGANDNTNDLYIKAVARVKSALRKDWKKKTAIDYAQTQNKDAQLQIRAQFSSLEEWTRLQRKLKRVNNVRDVHITALSQQEAYLEVSYHGTLEHLSLALAQQDMHLQEDRRNTPTRPQPSGLYSRYAVKPAPATYNLIYNRPYKTTGTNGNTHNNSNKNMPRTPRYKAQF